MIFEPGDIVYLRSGSFPLTVTAISDDGSMVNVRWADDDTLYKDCIASSALIPSSQATISGDDESKKTKKKKRVK